MRNAESVSARLRDLLDLLYAMGTPDNPGTCFKRTCPFPGLRERILKCDEEGAGEAVALLSAGTYPPSSPRVCASLTSGASRRTAESDVLLAHSPRRFDDLCCGHDAARLFEACLSVNHRAYRQCRSGSSGASCLGYPEKG